MSTMFVFLLFLPFISSTSIQSHPPASIFILAGQSNMAGRGGVINNTIWDGVVPRLCLSNPSIFRLNSNLKWVLANEPLHIDIDVGKINGVGPGMAFANTILTRVKKFGSVGLVPCAIGGTNITQWKRKGFLYNQLLRRSKAAVEGGGVVKGVLWYQGESDTVNKKDAEMYKERLKLFFSDIRSDMQLPLLAIFQVGLASGEGPYIEIVRQGQLGIELANVHFVDAKGLSLQTDGLHLTTQAQVLLGQMLADSFLHSLPTLVHAIT